MARQYNIYKKAKFTTVNINAQQDRDIQILLGICTGLISDNEINENEVLFLKAWLQDHQEIIEFYPARDIFLKIQNSSNEEIFRFLSEITGYQILGDEAEEFYRKHSTKGNLPFTKPSPPYSEDVFSFSGKFNDLTRKGCQALTSDLGGKFTDGITKKTTILVIGGEANPEWKFASYGRKIEKAIEWEIEIVTEDYWLKKIVPHMTHNS